MRVTAILFATPIAGCSNEPFTLQHVYSMGSQKAKSHLRADTITARGGAVSPGRKWIFVLYSHAMQSCHAQVKTGCHRLQVLRSALSMTSMSGLENKTDEAKADGPFSHAIAGISWWQQYMYTMTTKSSNASEDHIASPYGLSITCHCRAAMIARSASAISAWSSAPFSWSKPSRCRTPCTRSTRISSRNPCLCMGIY